MARQPPIPATRQAAPAGRGSTHPGRGKPFTPRPIPTDVWTEHRRHHHTQVGRGAGRLLPGLARPPPAPRAHPVPRCSTLPKSGSGAAMEWDPARSGRADRVLAIKAPDWPARRHAISSGLPLRERPSARRGHDLRPNAAWRRPSLLCAAALGWRLSVAPSYASTCCAASLERARRNLHACLRSRPPRIMAPGPRPGGRCRCAAGDRRVLVSLLSASPRSPHRASQLAVLRPQASAVAIGHGPDLQNAATGQASTIDGKRWDEFVPEI